MNKHRESQDIKSFEIKVIYMIAHASRKIREGKLVKVEVEYDNAITKLKITGDFFLHPEDILEKTEKSVLGLNCHELCQSLNNFPLSYRSSCKGC